MQSVRLGSVCLVSIVCLSAQTLSPREIFYGEGRAAVTPKPAAAKPRPSVAKAATPTVAPQMPSRTEEPEVPTIGANNSPAQDNVVRLVSMKTGPLGLKYSVLKRSADGQYTEVDPDSNFTAGDHIKVHVEVNDSGYLYVVAQGSSGKWTVMYPSPDVGGGDNRVKEGRQYSIPSDAVFTFDTRPGNERLFVVLSRQPEQDLESLIYSLRDKPADAEPKTLTASNTAPIQDDLVQRLRQTYSRDLVIEKVDDDKTPPPDNIRKIEVKHGAMIPPGEKAYYVVNRNAGENARVVADVELRHQ